MDTDRAPNNSAKAPRRWGRIWGFTAALFIAVALLSAWWVKHNVYASPFIPTKLNEKERVVLNEKLDRLGRYAQRDTRFIRAAPKDSAKDGRLVPERYTEDAARREIRITEKELNALIAKDKETARRVAIHLTEDMASVKLVIPVDDDFPVLGGKTLRLSCGIALRHEAGKPVVALRGVSIGGIPIPNAWLGNIKNIDLIQEFGGRGGFWQALSEGVDGIRVSEGSLFIRLRE